jgi:hypothetical protein
MNYGEWKKEVEKFKAVVEASRPRFRITNESGTKAFEAIATDEGGIKVIQNTLQVDKKLMPEFLAWLGQIYE